MKLKFKKIVLIASVLTLMSVPIIAKAAVPTQITSFGTAKSGGITTYCYAWTGAAGTAHWARTTENLFFVSTGGSAGVLASTYDANGYAQTPQNTYGLALFEQTTHTASGCYETSR